MLPKPLARVLAPLGDAGLDAALAQRLAAAGEVVALVRVQLLGRLIGLMPSSNSSKTFESWTLAAVRATASGTPLRSETTWRFEPGLPRSDGFLPTFSPPFWSPRSPNRARLAPSRSRRPFPAGRARPGAARATPQPPPARAGAASTCSRSRSPSPWEASPRVCRS